MRTPLPLKASRLFGALLLSGALLSGHTLSAWSQPPDQIARVEAAKTTIVGLSRETDSLRVATANGALDLWIGSAKFVKEERGLALADLKIGDTLSEFHNNDIVNTFRLQMNDDSGALPLTSLAPFVLERKAATDPDLIFPSTPAFVPSVFVKSITIQSGHQMSRAIYDNTGVTVTVTKPDYLPETGTVKYGEPGDGVVLTVAKPETMIFTRSTRIQSSDLAVGQRVSANITLDSDGKAVCHLLKVIIDK